MASKMGEQLALIFVLNDSRLKKSLLVGCKIQTKVHLFNQDAKEIEKTCKNYWKFTHVFYNSVIDGLGFFIS